MFKWTRTERAVRTKWRVTSYILFRYIMICAFQEADEVKCQYTQLKLSRQSNHPTLSLQPMAQRESEWRGIPAMTPCLGKAWKSQTAKSYKSISNAWLVWQISCDKITSLNLANVIQTCSNFFLPDSIIFLPLNAFACSSADFAGGTWKTAQTCCPNQNRHFKIHFKCEVSPTSFCLSRLRL